MASGIVCPASNRDDSSVGIADVDAPESTYAVLGEGKESRAKDSSDRILSGIRRWTIKRWVTGIRNEMRGSQKRAVERGRERERKKERKGKSKEAIVALRNMSNCFEDARVCSESIETSL